MQVYKIPQTSMYKKLILVTICAVISLGVSLVQADNNSDAIAIRVLPNFQHKSVVRWYQDQGFKGSPQSLMVGGYPAIRDGKTVFVGATNVKDNNGNRYFDLGDDFYTNIFVITYNQGGSDEAINLIFSEILNNWKFNTNLSESLNGSCSQLNEAALANCSKADACWSFEGDFKDSSPSGFTGVKVGNVAFSVGKSGKAMTLPQNNDSAYLDMGNILTASNKLTIAVDIFPTGPGRNLNLGGIIVNKENDYEIARAVDGTIIWAINDADLNRQAAWQWVSTGYIAPLNQWTNLVLVYGRNSVRTYANGLLVSDYNYSGSGGILTGNQALRVGSRGALGQEFQGKIDEVKIFKSVINQDCVLDADCAGRGYCSSNKSILIRDTKRLADLYDLNNLLNDYKQLHNNQCATIQSGSYLANNSISVWPSWQQTLGATFGNVLPVDPLNKLGICVSSSLDNSKYNPTTCWDENQKAFSVPQPAMQAKFNLPVSSLAYTYTASSSGRSCTFAMNFESGLTCNAAGGLCTAGNLYNGEALLANAGGSTDNAANATGSVAIACNLRGVSGVNFDGLSGGANTISITASEGAVFNDKNKIINNGASPATWGWSGGEPALIYQSGLNTRTIKYQIKAGLVPNTYVSNSNNINITATDSRGKTNSKTCAVSLVGQCGNGSLDGGEVCDNGINNKSFCAPLFAGKVYGSSSLEIPFCSYCSNSCLNMTYYGPYCGDSKMTNGEKCDSGAANGVTCTPTYGNSCTYCASDCSEVKTVKGGICGNGGPLESGEDCDNGINNGTVTGPVYNQIASSFSYCDSGCKIISGTNRYCGDGSITDAEQCDTAGNNGINCAAAYGQVCSYCDSQCKNAVFKGERCGDGIVQSSQGEDCDDGLGNGTDKACGTSCIWTKKVKPVVLMSTSTDGKMNADSVIYNQDSVITNLTIAQDGQYIKLGGIQPTAYAYIASQVDNRVAKIKVTNVAWKRECDVTGGGIRMCYWDYNNNEGGLTAYTSTLGNGRIKDLSAQGTIPSRTAVNLETGDVWVHFKGAPQQIARYDDDFNLLQGPCVIDASNSSGGSGGGVVIDKDGNAWAGNYYSGLVVQFKTEDNVGNTPACTSLASVSTGASIYGMTINADGNIFFQGGSLGRINIPALTVDIFSNAGVYNYGITVDKSGNPWWGTPSYGVKTISKSAPAGTAVTDHFSPQVDNYAVSIDLSGNIWGASAAGAGIHKYDTNGTLLMSFFADAHHGISGTSDGYIISPKFSTNILDIVTPGTTAGNTTFISRAYDVGAFYSYADMAGLNRGMQFRSGSWTKEIDSGNNNQHWGALSFDQTSLASGDISVYVGASSSPSLLNGSLLPVATWNSLTTYKDPARMGRYVLIKVVLRSKITGQSPVIWNLKIQ